MVTDKANIQTIMLKRIIITGENKSRIISLDDKQLMELKRSSFFEGLVGDFDDRDFVLTVKHDDLLHQLIIDFMEHGKTILGSDAINSIIYSDYFDLRMDDISPLVTREIPFDQLVLLLPILRDNHYLMRAIYRNISSKIAPELSNVLKRYSYRNYIFIMENESVKIYHSERREIIKNIDLRRLFKKYMDENNIKYLFPYGFCFSQDLSLMVFSIQSQTYFYSLDEDRILRYIDKYYGPSIDYVQIFEDWVYFLHDDRLHRCNILSGKIEIVKIDYEGRMDGFIISPDGRKILFLVSKYSQHLIYDFTYYELTRYSYAIHNLPPKKLRKMFAKKPLTFKPLKEIRDVDFSDIKLIPHEGTVALKHISNYYCVISIFKVCKNKLVEKLFLEFDDNIRYNISPDAKLLLIKNGTKIEIYQIESSKRVYEYDFEGKLSNFSQCDIDFLDPDHVCITIENFPESKIYQFDLKNHHITHVHSGNDLYSKVIHVVN